MPCSCEPGSTAAPVAGERVACQPVGSPVLNGSRRAARAMPAMTSAAATPTQGAAVARRLIGAPAGPGNSSRPRTPSEPSEKRLQHAIDQLLHRDHRQQQRRHRQQHVAARDVTFFMVNGTSRMPRTTSKPLCRSASDWKSALPSIGSSAGSVATHPLAIEFARIGLARALPYSIHALAPGRPELRVEHEQRSEDQQHQHRDRADDLDLELQQLRARRGRSCWRSCRRATAPSASSTSR